MERQLNPTGLQGCGKEIRFYFQSRGGPLETSGTIGFEFLNNGRPVGNG